MREVGSGENGVDAQKGHHLTPKTGRELSPLVRNHLDRDAEAGNPATEKGRSAGRGSDVRKRDGLHPPGEAVDDCQEVLMPLRSGQGTHEVEVEHLKTPTGEGKILERGLGVSSDFGDLTRFTSPAETANICGNAMPNKAPFDVGDSGIRALVGHPVDAGENPLDPRVRNQRTRRGRGDVAQERDTTR